MKRFLDISGQGGSNVISALMTESTDHQKKPQCHTVKRKRTQQKATYLTAAHI